MNKKDVSIIIPAFNEESHIGGLIDSIKENCDGRFNYEIIVIDKGSKDRTREIVEENGINVLTKQNVTISELRNIGVKETEGEILIFIDGDVCFDINWWKSFFSVIEQLRESPMSITGSIYGLRENATWVEKSWYLPILAKNNVRYLNGGHLITTRFLFKKLAGFDSRLETGEDWDFCTRAKKIGATIINNPNLKAIHFGYPQNLRWFFKREFWHGKGDFVSLVNFFSSRPALISFGIFGMLFFGILGSILINSFMPVLLSLFSVSCICLVSAVQRCGCFSSFIPHCTLLYCIYYSARFWSGFIAVTVGKNKR